MDEMITLHHYRCATGVEVVAGRRNLDFKAEYCWLPFGSAQQAHPNDLHIY